MADKRLDQVSQLTDFDYALIVKGEEVAKLSRQDFFEMAGEFLYGAKNAETLASVVAGEIGTVSVSKKGLAKSSMCNYAWTPTSSLDVLQIKASKRFCSLSLLVNVYRGGFNIVHFVNVGFAAEGVLCVKNNGNSYGLCVFKYKKSTGEVLIMPPGTENIDVEIIPLNYIIGLTYNPLSSSNIDTTSYGDATIIE